MDYCVGDLSDAADMEVLKTTDEIKKDWLNQRRGKFTASEFYRLMTYEKLGVHLPDGAKKYAEEKAVEMLTVSDDSEQWASKEMQWGIDHEMEAIAEFEKLTGMKVQFTGTNQQFFTLSNNESIGGTPDGIIRFDCGVEIKCPTSRVHSQYLQLQNQEQLKAKCANYYWQMQGLMMIRGCDNWHFVSYNQRFVDKKLRIKHLVIERNQSDIDHLYQRLLLAIKHRDCCIKLITGQIGE